MGKHVAAIALVGVIWLLRRRRNQAPAKPQVNLPPAPVAPRFNPQSINHFVDAGAAVASQSGADPGGPPANKNVLGAVLQWILLVLLGAALSLAAAKASWDVFGLLVTAAIVQLCSQLVRWIGGRSSLSTSRRSTPGSRPTRGHRRGGAAGGSEDAAPRAVPRVVKPDPRLGGVWIRDGARSDPMDEAVAAMRLNGIVRTAIKLIRGIEVEPAALRAGRFNMAVFSVISWFKVRESYLLDGTVGHYNRRDLRRGKHAAFVTVKPDGSLVLSVSWGEPLAGSGTDHFVVIPDPAAAAAAAAVPPGAEPEPSDGDMLVVTSTIRLAGPAAAAAEGQPQDATAAALPPPVVYRTLYTRGGRGHHHHHQQQQQQQDRHREGQEQGQPGELQAN